MQVFYQEYQKNDFYMVREEYQTSAPQCKRASGGISIRESVPQQRATRGPTGLLASKPKVEEEEDEMTALLHCQRLVASSDDPNDTPGINVAFICH
jgi:hypothetical protein